MKIFMFFTAGAWSGVLAGLVVWGFGALGLNQSLGFGLAPRLTLAWLVPMTVGGGVGGVFFLLPFWGHHFVRKGMVVGLVPLVPVLLVVLPWMGAGALGLRLGLAAPWLVLFFTMLWGVATALLLKSIGRDFTDFSEDFGDVRPSHD